MSADRRSAGREMCLTIAAKPRDSLLATLPDAVGRRLQVYVDLLLHWQKTINLVAPSTLPDVWTRHVADSLQVAAAAPEARTWIDFGSGGGFPGLVTAIVLADHPGAGVHLVESDKRKAAFLRTVARETGAPAIVHAERIEHFLPKQEPAGVEAVSARALAPLPQLLAYAEKFILAGAVGIFPKGQNAETELTGFDPAHRFSFESVASRTDPSSRLFVVRAGIVDPDATGR